MRNFKKSDLLHEIDEVAFDPRLGLWELVEMESSEGEERKA